MTNAAIFVIGALLSAQNIRLDDDHSFWLLAFVGCITVAVLCAMGKLA